MTSGTGADGNVLAGGRYPAADATRPGALSGIVKFQAPEIVFGPVRASEPVVRFGRSSGRSRR
jgi:hypothetical protein